MSLHAQLDVLETSGLIRRAQSLPELEYLFRHSLVQEAAYHSLLKQQRRALHQSIGEALEREAPGAPSGLAPVLAHHFYEAGDAARALKYYTLAGDSAARKFAAPESLAHYSRALALALDAGADSASLTHLYLARGRALETNGKYDEALLNDGELESVAFQKGDRSMELASLLARMTIYAAPTARFNPVEAQALAERAMALAATLNDRQAEAKILWNLVLLNRFTNRYDLAVQYGERSVALARELGLRDQLAYTLNDMFPGYMRTGDVQRGRAALQEAYSLWRELGNHPMVADSLTNMAEINWSTGQFRQSLAQAAESFQISRSVGNSWGMSSSSALMGMVSTELAEFDAALEHFARSQRYGREAGFVTMDIMCPAGIALCMAALGAPARGLMFARSALEAANRSLTSYRAFPLAIIGWLSYQVGDTPGAAKAIQAAQLEMMSSDPIFNPFIALAAGDVALRSGQRAQALLDSDTALALIQKYGLAGSAPAAWHLRARALLALGRMDEALEALQTSYAAAVRTGWRREFWSIADDLAQMEAVRGDVAATELHTAEARREVEFVACHAPDAELRESFLALPAVRRIMEHYA